MRQDRNVSFSPQEEKALNELTQDYRELLACREGRVMRSLRKLRLPEAVLSGKAVRGLAAVLLGVSLLCLAAVLAGIGRASLRPPVSALYTAAPYAPPERLAAMPQDEETEGRIMVNTAGAEELTLLPGIGPVLAERIIEERETNGYFHLPEDLLSVRGIGAATLEKILPQISLQLPEE